MLSSRNIESRHGAIIGPLVTGSMIMTACDFEAFDFDDPLLQCGVYPWHSMLMFFHSPMDDDLWGRQQRQQDTDWQVGLLVLGKATRQVPEEALLKQVEADR